MARPPGSRGAAGGRIEAGSTRAGPGRASLPDRQDEPRRDRARNQPHPRRGRRARRACWTSRRYDVDLDLTTGDKTFRSDDGRPVHRDRAGRRPRSPTWSPRPSTRSRSTGGRSTRRAVVGPARIALPDLAAENELRVVADCAYMQHRRGPAPVRRPGRRRGLPLHAVRGRRRPPGVRLLRAARPQGDRSRFTVTAPGALDGRRRTPRRPSRSRPATGTATWRFEPTPKLSTYITAVVAGPYHVVHGAYERRRPRRSRSASTAGRRWPSTSTPTTIFEITRQGFDVLRGDVRPPVPVREVRPALRAGVQRRRDGERRRGDHHASTTCSGRRSPQAMIERRAADDPARAGAHVVRRPGDHAVVGRPVAERVVRRVRVAPRCQAEATRWPHGVDDVRQRREDLGLPAGPAAVHAPDRRRHPRPRGRRGQLRRHHVRQGRVGAQAARALGRHATRSSRAAALLPAARLGQHRRCATCSRELEKTSGATWTPGPGSGSSRPASTRCARASRSTPTG